MNKRKILHDFLNGKRKKIVQSNRVSEPQIIILNSRKDGSIEILFGDKIIVTSAHEVDTLLEKMPNKGLILDFARPITKEEIEAQQAEK